MYAFEILRIVSEITTRLKYDVSKIEATRNFGSI